VLFSVLCLERQLNTTAGIFVTSGNAGLEPRSRKQERLKNDFNGKKFKQQTVAVNESKLTSV